MCSRVYYCCETREMRQVIWWKLVEPLMLFQHYYNCVRDNKLHFEDQPIQLKAHGDYGLLVEKIYP